MYRLLAPSLVGALLIAAPAPRGADPLRHLGPYLAEDTFVLGWLDVRNVDVDQVFARLRQTDIDAAARDAAQAVARKVRERLLAAGVTHVYVTNLGGPVPFEPLIVIPATDPQAVRETLPLPPYLEAKVAGGALLVGPKKALERAARRSAKAPPEIAAALPKLPATPSGVLVLPPKVLLRVLGELQPQLPPELGGAPTAPLIDAFRWAGLGLDLSDKLSLQWTIQARDEAGARLLGSLLERGLAVIKKNSRAPEAQMLVKLMEEKRHEVTGDQVRWAADARVLDSVIVPLAGRVTQNARAAQAMNNLRQVALAMHGFHDVYKSFPAQASVGKDGRPLLSWRVQILPFVEAQGLHKQFRLDEPWDSEHNKTLIPKMPPVFRSPLSRLKAEDGRTTVVIPSGPKAFFHGTRKGTFRDITDGTSNTIMVLDVDDSKAVVWTKPDDYPVDPKTPNAGHYRPGMDSLLTVFFDGAGHRLPTRLPDAKLWLYFCPNDGQAIQEVD